MVEKEVPELLLWDDYRKEKDEKLLVLFLDQVACKYASCLEKDFEKPSEGPHLFSLPDEILQAIENLLRKCSNCCNPVPSNEVLQISISALKASIIVCRNLDNIPFVSSCEIVSNSIIVASAIVRQLNQELYGDLPVLIDKDLASSYLLLAVHLLECLYDPYFTWRAQRAKKEVNFSAFQYGPSCLHQETIPFFYDCFQAIPCQLPEIVQLELLELFGAILSGGKHNGLLAITPATIEVLAHCLLDICTSNIRQLTLECLIQILFILNSCPSDERCEEIATVLNFLLQAIQKMCTEKDISIAVNVLETLASLLSQRNGVSLRKVFQDGNYCETIIHVLEDIKLQAPAVQDIASAIVHIITAYLSRGARAKKHFVSVVGFSRLCKILQTLGQPSQKLLESLMSLACESLSYQQRIKNADVSVCVINWLPKIEDPELQALAVEQILNRCTLDVHTKINCCQAKMISAILDILEKVEILSGKSVGYLLKLLEILASHSISSNELKQLFLLLRPDSDGRQFRYILPMMYVLSSTAKKDGWMGASYFLDLQEPQDGITVHKIQKWPGTGFTFHGWVYLDKRNEIKTNGRLRHRRQLYTFLNSYGGGFEGFVNEDSLLVVASRTKKEFQAAIVADHPLDDQNWHCIDVSYAASKRPFTQSSVVVYIDGRQRLTAQLKFPSLSEPFTHCRIGVGGQCQNLYSAKPDSGDIDVATTLTNLGGAAIGHLSTIIDKERLMSLAPHFTIPHALKAAIHSSPDPSVRTCLLGTQDTIWGIPDCFKGQLGSLCVFSEALFASHIKALYSAGPNNLTLFKSDEGTETAELPSKLVFYYDAKAYAEGMCVDLSPCRLYDGQLSGHQCIVTNIKDVINTIGGIQVLYPLLENASRPPNTPSPTFSGFSPKHIAYAGEDISDEWVVLPHTTDSVHWRLRENQVASFLVLLSHMIQGHDVNQEQLISKNGIASIGVLMQKVLPSQIDVSTLMATELMVESISACENATDLLKAVYQFILFDFRIWSKGDFAVRIGHIQYLSTIIKDDRKYFRKKYGVQFMLDIIRMFYSNCDLLSTDDVKTVRVSLLGLVKYYVSRDANIQEVSAIIGFLITVKKEDMVIEVLDLLLNILEGNTVKDQFFLLMYEPGYCELLHCLLFNPDFTERLKVKVLKVIILLLKTDRVYEKFKIRLRLHDIGFSALTSFLPAHQISKDMAVLLAEQVLLTDTAASYEGILAFLNFICMLDINLKLEVAKVVKSVLDNRPSSLPTVAKQMGWHECFLGLLIKHNIVGIPVPVNRLPSLNLIDLNVDSISDKESKTDSPRANAAFRRLSQLSTLSLEDTLPRTPQVLMQLKEHIFDFELPNLLSRSKSGSQSSSSEDLTSICDDSKTLSSATNSPIFLDKFVEKSSVKTDTEDEEIAVLLDQDSIEKKSSSSEEVDDETSETKLFKIITDIVVNIMWKGISGSNKQSWAERGQVFVCINMLALSYELFFSHLEVKRVIIEGLLNQCLTNLQETGQASAAYTENSFELMRLVYDFVVLDTKDDRRLSEQLLEGVLALLDILLVFEEAPGEEGWPEMAEIGLDILLIFADSKNLALCAMATAKLHALVQTRPFASIEETCYLLTSIDGILSRAIETGDQEHYSFLIPIVRALIEKVNSMLNLQKNLPALPKTSLGPSFFEDFQQYALSSEWKVFIDKIVKVQQKTYKRLVLDEQRELMNTFWNRCYESLMIARHKRNREVGESKLRFQSQVMEIFYTKLNEEQTRYQSVQTTLRHQNVFVQRRWRLAKLSLYGPRGPWKARYETEKHWKLSHHENFSRMRLKLILNHTFDDHRHASCLRDNQAMPFQPKLDNLPPVAREAKVSQQQEDSLTEEELQISFEIDVPDTAAKEKSVISQDCELVTLLSVVKGRFEVTTTHMYFFDLSPVKEESERHDFKCSLSQLREIHLRRYNLRRSALEFFLIDQTNFFLNFTTKTRNKIYSRIVGLRPVNLFYSHGIRSPAELLKVSGLTQKWIQREISNFEYLMQLNTIAGRTYNDLSQYPVFPWVLADFVSEDLNLENVLVYRDLSKPIGVVNPKNIPEVKAKFDNFVDITGTVEKFHYGTHYSNSAGVVLYLVRMEPFTSLHIEIQGGRFDVPDRQFHSIEATWRMMMENPNDVKELIPEFFYLPEFLININDFDLGKLQISKEQVNHVKLPPWAESPEDFIYKHRKALESEYVSSHLHEWIDLIFGYKQKGPAAVEALNLFYYVSYEGAVDLDAIEDRFEREATEGMINNFGQTPCQLLKEPHPKRMLHNEAVTRMLKSDTRPPNLFLFLQNLKAFFVEASTSDIPIVFIAVPKNPVRSFLQHGMLESLITVAQNGSVGVHGWLPYDRSRSVPNYFTFERDPTLASNKTARIISGPFLPGLEVTSKLFAVTGNAKFLITGGHWDNSLRVYSLSKLKLVSHIIRHSDVITCLALDHTNTYLITGSRDTTCMIWEINLQGGTTFTISSKPLHILYGHDMEVTCVIISTELDMAISASKDGSINIHTVREGYYMRTLWPPDKSSQSVTYLALCEMGYICAHYQPSHCKEEGKYCKLHLYSINGAHICQKKVSPMLAMYCCGDYLVLGGTDGTLTVLETFRLKTVTSLSLHIPILSISVTPSNTHVLASLEDGKLIVIGISTTNLS